jgi:hypothetical protein
MDFPGEWTEASVDGEEIDVSKVPAEQRGTFAMTQLKSPR